MSKQMSNEDWIVGVRYMWVVLNVVLTIAVIMLNVVKCCDGGCSCSSCR